MKSVKDLLCGSPSSHFLNLVKENQEKIEFAKKFIIEIEEFVEQYRKYLSILERIQEVLNNEKVE